MARPLAVSSIAPTMAELQAQMAELLAANAALQAKVEAKSKISFKVSEKGAVSLYGMGRFPVTLYGEQWERILAHADELRSFLAANKSRLSTKA